jgi:hypothetical protein
MLGRYAEAVRELGLQIPEDRLRTWITRRPEWPGIKRTLGTGNGNGAGPHAPAGGKQSPPPAPTRTLAEFLRDKRREGCPVCALSPEILQCLAEASTKGTARVPEQVEWLNADCGARITVQELTAHRAGRHET